MMQLEIICMACSRYVIVDATQQNVLDHHCSAGFSEECVHIFPTVNPDKWMFRTKVAGPK